MLGALRRRWLVNIKIGRTEESESEREFTTEKKEMARKAHPRREVW